MLQLCPQNTNADAPRGIGSDWNCCGGIDLVSCDAWELAEVISTGRTTRHGLCLRVKIRTQAPRRGQSRTPSQQCYTRFPLRG